MELAFQTNRMPYLKRVVQEVRVQEETAETIVPDSYPDMASIVDAYAVAVLRGKDCRNGSVTISGGIKGGVLYIPEDHTQPRPLEFYIPFTMKLEHSALTEQTKVLCSVRVRSADGRMVNSRKAMLRVNLSVCITGYEQAEETLYRLQTCPEPLQLRRSAYCVQLPLEVTEKSFMVNGDLELSTSRAPVRQVCKVVCRLETTDRKLVGNKAVFKGTAVCKLLYLSEDDELYLHEQQFPFSQYCELENDYDEETVDLLPVITGYDLDLQEGAGSVTIHILAQCTVRGSRELQLVEDAYCVQGTLQPQWHTYDLDSCLDRQVSMQTVRQQLRGDIKQIVDTDVYVDHPVPEQSADLARIKAPVMFRVLGYDAQGSLTSLSGKSEASLELPVSHTARCTAWAELVGGSYAVSVSEGADIRCELALETVCSGGQPMRTLEAGSLEEATAEPRPSVILRRVPQNASLWDLAKSCASREEAIRTANHLEGDILPEEQFLLIPVG